MSGLVERTKPPHTDRIVARIPFITDTCILLGDFWQGIGEKYETIQNEQCLSRFLPGGDTPC
jgi:hypothetical protein